MLISSFPDHVEWRKLILQQTAIKAEIALKKLSRFRAELADTSAASVVVELEFLKDEEHRSCIRGQLEAAVKLKCQRCMQPLDHTIKGDFEVYLVTSAGQQQALPKQLDSVLLEDDTLDLLRLVEDELLLQLPFTIYHEIQACDPAFRYNAPEIEISQQEEEKPNPFAVLESLKKKT